MPAEVDHRDLVQFEGPQVGLDPGPQLLGSLCADPLTLVVAGGADLGNQHELLGVGIERLVQKLVGHVGAVELRGVDVIDAGLDGPSDDGQGAA